MSLQKFKLLATRCGSAGASGNPTQSPTTSPVIVHFRRRKTLRMLLSRTSSSSNSNNPDRRLFQSQQHRRNSTEESSLSPNRKDNNNNRSKQQMSVRQKLKDLLVASPPAIGKEDRGAMMVPNTDNERRGRRVGESCGGGMRPLTATLRQRLMRRPWRPVLVAIPEISP